MYGKLGGYFAPDATDDDEVFDYSEDGLGLALPAVGGAISAISSVFGGNSKDPNRIATNTRAYNQAVSGNDGPFEGASSALEFLRIHAVMNDADGGWATQAATSDAATKYNRALAVINGQSGAPAGTPVQGAGILHSPVVAGMSVPPLVLAGAAAFGIYMLTKSGRRR